MTAAHAKIPAPENAAIAVIGASAGAIDALKEIFALLPASLGIPVVVVIHISPDHNSILPEVLGMQSPLPVFEAEDKQPMRAGEIYVAPPNYHLMVEREGLLSLSSEDPVRFSRPSIDILFESAADSFAERAIGIVLTGANDDGARGLRAIVDAGGLGVIERPDLAAVPDMPAAAAKACPAALLMSLPEIAGLLAKVEAEVQP